MKSVLSVSLKTLVSYIAPHVSCDSAYDVRICVHLFQI
jgi:hypothetical protein